MCLWKRHEIKKWWWKRKEEGRTKEIIWALYILYSSIHRRQVAELTLGPLCSILRNFPLCSHLLAPAGVKHHQQTECPQVPLSYSCHPGHSLASPSRLLFHYSFSFLALPWPEMQYTTLMKWLIQFIWFFSINTKHLKILTALNKIRTEHTRDMCHNLTARVTLRSRNYSSKIQSHTKMCVLNTSIQYSVGSPNQSD